MFIITLCENEWDQAGKYVLFTKSQNFLDLTPFSADHLWSDCPKRMLIPGVSQYLSYSW